MQHQYRKLSLPIFFTLVCSIITACNSGSSSSNSGSGVSYSRFNCPGSENVAFPGVSGVRQVYGIESEVYVTGVYVQYGSNHAFLYQGPVLGGGVCQTFNFPSAPGRTVTSTSLYGPDNNGFGKVVVVGSYTTLESGPIAQQGLLYQGNPDGSTISGYTTLYPQSLLANGETILNTLGHSTMGGIVVGNFDTNLATGRAFIYNINTGQYYELQKPLGSASITAYGIWYNGGTSYTITGGYSNVKQGGLDIGFITDWDSQTGQLSHFTTLSYNNLPESEVVTHFEGITTDDKGGYNLAGDWKYITSSGKTLPAFANISRNPDGSFKLPQWIGFDYFPGASWTSANTIYRNYILGLSQSGDPVTDFGYVATIPFSN